MLAAQLNTTDQTVTVSKNFTEPENITETVCTGRCNITCFLPNQSLQEFPACLPNTVRVLDLAFNHLSVVRDQDVADLSELRNLSLAHNQIKEILWGSHVLAQLESLDLSYNQLSVVPRCKMLKKLQWLSLAGNPISHIPSLAFTCFPNLAFLSLSSTLIGSNSSADIDESAFALNVTESQMDSLTSLHLLDLSATYLHRSKYKNEELHPSIVFLSLVIVPVCLSSVVLSPAQNSTSLYSHATILKQYPAHVQTR